MLKLFIATIGAYASATTIPIQFRPDGSVVIPNITVPGLTNPTQDVVLWMGSNRIFHLGTHEDETLVSRAMMTENGFRFDQDLWLTIEFGSRAHTWIEIGIGPSSDIASRYGAINVLRTSSNNGSLILGGDDSRDHFQRSCVPDSITSIPFDYSRDHVQQMEFWLNSTTGGSVQHIPETRFINLFPVHTRFIYRSPLHTRKILGVPRTMANSIIDILIGTGAIPVTEDRLYFSNCSNETVISQLPEIVLQFPESRFILYPEDYMTFNNARNECALNFEISSDRFNAPFINPLRFPFVNLHITRTEMLICDSLA
jgi:hypothetical protein